MKQKKKRFIQDTIDAAFGKQELYKKRITMRLNLALNGILIASAPVEPSRWKDEYYLQALRHQILQQNKDTLALIPAKPFFYIEVPASAASLSYGRGEKRFNA